MPQYQLVVRRGPRAGEVFELKSQTVIIGRDSTADIIINDPEVSRNHCRLILDRSYYLQDLGSTNGTFVDGQRLGGEPVRLANGQIVQLGSNVTLLHQEIETNPDIISTQMVAGDDPAVSNPSAPVDPPPVFGQQAEPPSQAPPPQQHPPAQPLPNYQNPNTGQPNMGQPNMGQQPPTQELGGRAGYSVGRDTPQDPFEAYSDNQNDGPSGDSDSKMPWANWTQQQWMIAAGVLLALLLCVCCLFIVAVVVAVNPDLLAPATGGVMGSFLHFML